MPLTRVRFTVRRMMVAVLVVAAIMGAFAGLRRRSEHLRRIGQGHAHEATRAAIDALNIRRKGGFADGNGAAPDEALAERSLRICRYHLSLSVKYGRAAARPWPPVAPDTPGPK